MISAHMHDSTFSIMHCTCIYSLDPSGNDRLPGVSASSYAHAWLNVNQQDRNGRVQLMVDCASCTASDNVKVLCGKVDQ